MLSLVQNKEGYIAVLAIVSIAIHLVFQYLIPNFQAYSLYPLYPTLVVDLVKKLVTFKFGSDLLAGMSIVTEKIKKKIFLKGLS